MIGFGKPCNEFWISHTVAAHIRRILPIAADLKVSPTVIFSAVTDRVRSRRSSVANSQFDILGTVNRSGWVSDRSDGSERLSNEVGDAGSSGDGIRGTICAGCTWSCRVTPGQRRRGVCPKLEHEAELMFD